MNVWEYLFTAVVVVAALLYLYRVFFVRKGCSCGSCPAVPAKSPRSIRCRLPVNAVKATRNSDEIGTGS